MRDLETKCCSRCGEVKSTEAFHRNRARADGYQNACKSCQRAYVRAHYASNPAYYKAKARKQKREVRAEIRALVQAKKDVPCTDCGQRFPYFVMDFDHVRGEKLFDIGRAVRNQNVEQVRAEIAKCEVVCANCHRVREHERRTLKR